MKVSIEKRVKVVCVPPGRTAAFRQLDPGVRSALRNNECAAFSANSGGTAVFSVLFFRDGAFCFIEVIFD